MFNFYCPHLAHFFNDGSSRNGVPLLTNRTMASATMPVISNSISYQLLPFGFLKLILERRKASHLAFSAA
jgi:hypothetical protein